MKHHLSISNAGAAFVAVLLCVQIATAAKQPELPLNESGKKLLEEYSKELETLRSEVAAAVPKIDETKKSRFVDTRSKWDGLKSPTEDTPLAERKTLEENKEQLQTDSTEAAQALMDDMAGFIASDELDPKLMKIAVLAHATPRGLAEFGQKGATHKKLLDDFFADEELMRQVLEAGGANGGEYGGMMEVYNRILEKSEKAGEKGGILQRLALGTAIHMPWSGGKPEGGVYGTVYRTRYDVDQVKRYLHFEKAYLEHFRFKLSRIGQA